jgi:hypothetical protein
MREGHGGGRTLSLPISNRLLCPLSYVPTREASDFGFTDCHLLALSFAFVVHFVRLRCFLSGAIVAAIGIADLLGNAGKSSSVAFVMACITKSRSVIPLRAAHALARRTNSSGRSRRLIVLVSDVSIGNLCTL